jgi:hypothetical protein
VFILTSDYDIMAASSCEGGRVLLKSFEASNPPLISRDVFAAGGSCQGLGRKNGKRRVAFSSLCRNVTHVIEAHICSLRQSINTSFIVTSAPKVINVGKKDVAIFSLKISV